MNNEKKNKIKGIAGTVAFHLGILLVLLLMALRIPPQLPGGQGGVEVNLGYTETGMGVDQQDLPMSSETQVQLAPQPKKEVEKEEEYLVQDDKDAPAIVEKKTEIKKKPPQKTPKKVEPEPQEEVKAEPAPVQPPQPQADPKAMYKGKGTSKTGGQEGITGQPGDQGDPSGVPGANIYKGKSGSGTGSGGGTGSGTGTGSGNGTGSGDGPGNGISYDLGGRGSLMLQKPAYTSKEQGKVVVTIKVDRNGKVISAVAGAKGTNVGDLTLQQLAKDAALQSKFKADPDAPEFQVGTITYNFIRQN